MAESDTTPPAPDEPQPMSQAKARAGSARPSVVISFLVVLGLAGALIWLVPPSCSCGSQADMARTKAKGLAHAVEMYRVKNAAYPDDLTELTEPDYRNDNKPYVPSSDAILDPWGKQYQMDVNGPHHDGKEPDIFTIDPEGKTVGNWAEPR